MENRTAIYAGPALLLRLSIVIVLPVWATAAIREESFDREPADWEGVNNRNTHLQPRTVTQDLGNSVTIFFGDIQYIYAPDPLPGSSTLQQRRTP